MTKRCCTVKISSDEDDNGSACSDGDLFDSREAEIHDFEEEQHRQRNIYSLRFWADFEGATHLHEYPYMFGVSPFYDFVVNEDELKLQRAILETFTHFAKYGTPSTEEYPWEPVTAEHPLRHMRFRPESKVQEGFLEENIAFWELMNEYDYDIIRGVRRSHQTGKDEL
ncbi:unnamed protein product [Toxocara canis]|uniref:COesterase domain-containing protein n=1 Tax=Toxocara canis TaxID=6265 RepID=A0A183TWI2_TOXCA|nr:unnamed protein product [Toxocara canis]